MVNEERGRRHVRLFIGILFGVCCLAYGYWYLVSTMPDPDVRDECQAIAASVESTISLPPSVSSPGHPAFFCGKGVRGLFLRPYDRVRVYGVVNSSGQDTLIAAIVRAKQQLRTRPIVVDFYEKENWITWSDPKTGRSGGDRRAEMPIRRNVIK